MAGAPVTPLVRTALPLPLFARGKVRDVYDLGDHLLIVATDRLSAFDHILPTPIPDKGRVLTALSAFWFDFTRTVVANHMLTVAADEMPASVMPASVRGLVAGLEGRAMLVRRAERIDAECVVRGYLAGSAWTEYRATGAVAGIRLPAGLTEGASLSEPLFTPATKSAAGHDENITFETLADMIGGDLASRLRDLSLAVYTRARAHARGCGLVVADTKFEFGFVTGAGNREVILIDEVLTPDSSRFWDAAAHARGDRLPFDKQFVRDYLLRSGWDREPPAPALPDDVVAATRARYLEAHLRLTGRPLH
jgi:phosphoribosylaminoimidazole-succinocarboxamide synthase